MILTVTLNPAVDKTCCINELILGQLNRLETVTSIAGGKGINVTKVLRQFDMPVIAMGFLGGYSGRMIEEKMKAMGAECQFIPIAQETRINTNILAENGYVTEVLEPGPEISEKELETFWQTYKEQLERADIVVLSGSIPKGVPTDIYAALTAAAKDRGCKVFLDTSGEALKAAVKAVPYLIKPNQKELEYLVGRKLRDTSELIKEAEALLKTGIEKVIISMGAQGLLSVDKEGAIHQPACKVKARNTVACGDSVVASYCMSEKEQRSREEAARYAAALAAANAATTVSAEIQMDLLEELLK